MPRRSATHNVRKICGCAKWKECAHPWYVHYREGKELAPTGKIRERGLRRKLADLVGREPVDYADAKAEARRAIVAWQAGRDPRGPLPSDDVTLTQLLTAYTAERPQRDRWHIGRIAAARVTSVEGGTRPFGTWRASVVSLDALKAYQRSRPIVAGNRDLQLLRAAFNWGVLHGLLLRSPFRVGDVPAVRLAREQARTRRLQPGEAERLLGAAGGLSDLIVAALETGCRRGELLSLQWHQVRTQLFLSAHKTKTKRDRRIPISTELAHVLARRRLDAAGETLPADAYVFGDEVGRRRHSIKTAWRLTLKRAKITDLHFHDLRREAGSRWMDAGVSLAEIQRWLGHANIAQTSTYLGASIGNDDAAMRAYEERIGRLPNVAVSAGSDGSQSSPSDPTSPEKPQENPTVH